MAFETAEKNRKLFVKFHLFGKSFSCDFSRFSELLDFSKSCLPESSAMRNFNKVKFSDAISRKSARLRFSDIHNPSLRFLHRWMSFTLFPMVKLHSVITPEFKCMFAMVKRISIIASSNNDSFVMITTYVHRILSVINCRDTDIFAEWRKSVKLVVLFLINNTFNANNFSFSLKNDMVLLAVS
jgi:hypothetical protein